VLPPPPGLQEAPKNKNTDVIYSVKLETFLIKMLPVPFDLYNLMTLIFHPTFCRMLK
jgi:hypothetical protein